MPHHHAKRPPRLLADDRPLCPKCRKPRNAEEFTRTEEACLLEFSFSLLLGGARMCERCYGEWREMQLAKAERALAA